MTQESEVREKKTYTFRNEDTSPRMAIVEHPVRAGYQLRSEAKPFETTADWMRFRLPVASKETAVLSVEEARPIQATYQLTSVTSDQIELFVRQKSIDKGIEEALRKILAQKAVVSDLDDQKTARDDETSKIYDDQQRLRENMKALKGSAEEKVLLQRYTRQLNDQEDRLEALRKEIKTLESQSENAQSVLDKMIQDLSFDVKL
jgi:chromosome segregation ATPase